jgi:hypothetical protein
MTLPLMGGKREGLPEGGSYHYLRKLPSHTPTFNTYTFTEDEIPIITLSLSITETTRPLETKAILLTPGRPENRL